MKDMKSGYKTKGNDVEKLFKERQDDRVGLLKESIADIENMIISREQLHNELMTCIAEIDSFINNNMPDMGSAVTDVTRDLIRELLKKKIDIQELRVEEKLNFWRDKALLKKELREHMKEFRDMESRSSMIDNILGI